VIFAQFRYVDGPRAGQTRVAGADFATIGRHPGSDVPFDPEADLQVSVRHAAVFKQGGGFLIRDLGSTNGTFLNGRRVRGDLPLEPGDVLQLGPTGPRLEFTVVDALPREAMMASPPAATRSEPSRFRRPRTRTTERLVAVRRESSRWKWIAAVAAGLALLAGGQWVRQVQRDRDSVEAARAALLARVDDLLTRLQQTQSPVAGIAGALARARARVDTLRREIASTDRAPALDTLAGELVTQAERHDDVIRAATLDPRAVTAESEPAVLVVVAELQAGQVVSGTGFAVKSAGDSVWVVTARHLVQDSAGHPAGRLAVIFNGSGQAFRAEVARVHDTADLAVLTTRIRGGAPVVKGVTDSVALGDPVALLGFPGGLDSMGNWRARGTSATRAVGTVAALLPSLVAVDGYGTAGSSGGPVVGPSGEVIGVISGGDRSGERGLTERPLVLAVPGRLVHELLAREASRRGRG
jgi:S1-C subfamily serine protease